MKFLEALDVLLADVLIAMDDLAACIVFMLLPDGREEGDE